MLRTIRVNPQTSTKDLQHDLAADGVTLHRSTIRRTLHKEMLYGRVMQRKPFLRPHHKQSRLRVNKYNVLEWPSQSRDLNIIENLWCHLKRAVHARKPSDLNELEMFCKEEWSKIPSATIQTLIRSYRKRLEAVISAKGGSTK
ncbi:hypothetical protein NFI96_011739 [Prochilodus magdalenae]|nr:hypothetical protein NFI96_011739 [Prochilodus magdalenae]